MRLLFSRLVLGSKMVMSTYAPHRSVPVHWDLAQAQAQAQVLAQAQALARAQAPSQVCRLPVLITPLHSLISHCSG